MTKPGITITPEQSLGDAYTQFREQKIRRLPVVEEDRMIGILTLTDIQRLLYPQEGEVRSGDPTHLTVKDVMTPSPLTTEPKESIESVAARMHRSHVSSMPVVEAGKVVGMITESDLFRAFTEVTGSEIDGVRIAVKLPHGSDALCDVLSKLEPLDATLISVLTKKTYSKTEALVVFRVVGPDAQEFAEAIRTGPYPILDLTQ